MAQGTVVSRHAKTVRVLGIDPGSRITGYGIIDSDGRSSRLIDSGYLRLEQDSMPAKLGAIADLIYRLVQQWSPGQMAIEEVFMARNAASALKLGHARGAAISAAVVAELPVYEYSAKAVKLAVVGTGAASKEQVQHMVLRIVNERRALQPDEADGIAVALCHAHTHLGALRYGSVKVQ